MNGKVKFGTPLFIPQVQQIRKVEALWDTGAWISLVHKRLVSTLEAGGARVSKLQSPKKLGGIGGGTLFAREMLHTTLKLNDGVARPIQCYVVPESPYDMIVGQPFMNQMKLACLLTSKTGFELIDYTKPDKPVAHSTQAHDLVGCVAPADRKIITTTVTEHVPWTHKAPGWESHDETTKLFLLRTMSQRILSGEKALTEEEALRNLERVGFSRVDEVENLIAMTTETQTDVQCDFPEVQQELNAIIAKYPNVFSAAAADVGRANGKVVKIRLAKKEPVNVANYRTPLKLKDHLKALIDELETAGIIEPSADSDYNSPVLLVPKKTDVGAAASKESSSNYRLVVDYRQLNKVIENIVYPMPRVQDILSEYHGCTAFTVVDIRHAYYTIEIDAASRKLTAFSCELGKWQFKFLPQGLKTAPAIFQQRISQDLKGLKRVQAYMDDIISGDQTPKQHLKTIDATLFRLDQSGYKLKLPKCQFMRKLVHYSGWMASWEGIAISPDKLEGAKRLAKPKTLSGVKSVLGFTSFLRAHVPCYCDVVGHIQALLSIKGTKGDANIERYWTPTHDRALNSVKAMLLDNRVLKFPDPRKEFILYTDASKLHMSGVLMQYEEVKLHPIGYWSKSFKGSQMFWSALVKEARAVLEAVQHFEVYIKGAKTELRCDHKPLARFLEARTKNEMVNRWSLNIQEYDIRFVWVASEDNVSDCLSRLVEPELYVPHDLTGENLTEFQEYSKPKKPKDIPMEVDAADENILVTAAATPSSNEKEQIEALGLNAADISTAKLTRLSDEQLKMLQAKDAYCQRITKTMKTMKEENGKFLILNGLLHKVTPETQHKQDKLPSLAVVVPAALQLTVVVNLHKELLHAGRDRMLSTLKQRVYWKRMDKQVAAFVQGCQICRYKRLAADKHPLIHIKPPLGPGKRLAIDCWECGGYIALTGICLHSQYPFAVEIADKQGSTVASALQDILAMCRDPTEILSDNGPEFMCKEMRELLEARHIKHVTPSPNDPESNGILERFHRYLNWVVRVTINFSPNGTWWPSVRAALEAYRKIPHTSTGETPLFLFTGQEPVYTIDHLLPTKPREIWNSEENKLDLAQLHLAYALARKNTCLARQRNRTVMKQRDHEIEVGDRVYRKNFSRDKRKVDPSWLPGFRVIGKESSRTMIIAHTISGIKSRVSVKHLKWADPVSELLANSAIDVFPGNSKMYLHSNDLEDLKWPAILQNDPLEPAAATKANEAARDRSKDTKEQVTNTPAVPTAALKGGGSTEGRPSRQRRPPSKLRDYIAAIIQCEQ